MVQWQINPNQSPVDIYSTMHLFYGMCCGAFGVSFTGALVSSLVWEYVLEPMYKTIRPDLFPVPSQDSMPNRLCDTAAVLVGWRLTHDR